jgi:branched-chain amino acid transport system permease protein
MNAKNIFTELRYPSRCIPALAIVFLLIFPFLVTNEYIMQVGIMVLLFAIMGSGWNIIAGFGGQLSLGHAAFVGIGAYVSTLLFVYLEWTPWIGMLVGGLVSACFGVLVGYPCFKLRGAYYALATIAYGELVRIFVQNTNQIGPIDLKGAQGILVPMKGDSFFWFQWTEKTPYYYVALIMMLLVILLCAKIKNSKFGYYLAAIGDDQEAAESLGVDSVKMKLYAAAISSFVMAVSGTFYAQFLLYIGPQGLLIDTFSTEIALVGIIGGASVMGPIVGAFILTPVSEATRILLGGQFIGVHLVVYGAILMAVITYAPQGILPYVQKFYYKFLGKLGDPNYKDFLTAEGTARGEDGEVTADELSGNTKADH